MVKTSPSNGGGAGSIPHTLCPKNQNMKQKQYCNKLNKDFKKMFLMWSKHKKKKYLYQSPGQSPLMMAFSAEGANRADLWQNLLWIRSDFLVLNLPSHVLFNPSSWIKLTLLKNSCSFLTPGQTNRPHLWHSEIFYLHEWVQGEELQAWRLRTQLSFWFCHNLWCPRVSAHLSLGHP